MEATRRAGWGTEGHRVVRAWASRAAAPLVLALTLAASGCATTSTFTPYTAQMYPIIRDLADSRPIRLEGCLVSQCSGRDALLYRMKRGRISQLLGDYRFEPRRVRHRPGGYPRGRRARPVSASGVAAQAGSILLNDNAIPYRAEGYERVMLHHPSRPSTTWLCTTWTGPGWRCAGRAPTG